MTVQEKKAFMYFVCLFVVQCSLLQIFLMHYITLNILSIARERECERQACGNVCKINLTRFIMGKCKAK